MKHSNMTFRGDKQGGIALIMTLFVLVILSLLGLGYMVSSSLETKINTNSRSAYPVYYAAEAGLEEATYRLTSGALNPISTTLVNMPSKVVYLRQATSIDPTSSGNPYYDTTYSSSGFTTVSYAATNQGTNAIPYQWVKISLKTKRLSGQDIDNGGLSTNQDVPIYYDGSQYVYDPAHGINASRTGFPVYQLTSHAQSTDGATSILRREISNAGFPGLPGALFFDGPTPVFNAPNSNPFWINGNDSAGSGNNKAAIAVITDAADTAISSGLPRPTHYIGSGGTTPDVQNVAANLPASYNSPQGLEDVANQVAQHANGTYAAGTTTCSGADCWGTAANPVINVFNGDCNLGNGTGYGLLIVRGNFHMQGNGSFNGLILIIGQGTMDFNGGGNGQINGGIFLAKTRDVSGNILSDLGSPSVDWNGGGGNGIYYNSALVNQMFNGLGFLKLAYKELN